MIPLLCACAQMGWFTESLHNDWEQTFKMDQVVFEVKTDHQNLVIFDNPRYGRVLALDGIIQLTERDEYSYHEMMAHVPILAHGKARRVLIIGGGDGGVLREVLKHRGVEQATLVDIDRGVIDMTQKYLPSLPNGAFENPRARIIIADGLEFVKTTKEKFDVVICDSTDPIGPGEALFTPAFFAGCKRVLNKGGIFVNQNGVPFVQGSCVTDTYKDLSPLFAAPGFYLVSVPVYIGGQMTLGWATDNASYVDVSVEELRTRMQDMEGSLKYYTPEVHKAAFALPQFVIDLIPKSS